jgi:hypothetical protein
MSSRSSSPHSRPHAAQKAPIVDQGGHQNTVIRDNAGSFALSRQSKEDAAPQ